MYQGRSPLNDVVRSVVVGATMISPAVLEGCSRSQQPPVTPPPPPIQTSDAGALQIAAQDAAAPPPQVVRPRAPENTGNMMPTRGFAGGARVRG